MKEHFALCIKTTILLPMTYCLEITEIKLYKIVNCISPEIMKDVFQLKGEDMYCSRFPFKNRNICTAKYGTKPYLPTRGY